MRMKKWMTGFAAILLGADLFCKYRTEQKADGEKEKELFRGKVLIRKVHNHGFALNVLSGEDRIVKGGSLLAGILLLCYHVKLFFSKKGTWKFAGTSLMLAGALSNLYDRFRRGYVVDYIGFAAADPQIRKITFNIGDFCLMAGAAVLAAAQAARSVTKEIRKEVKKQRKTL